MNIDQNASNYPGAGTPSVVSGQRRNTIAGKMKKSIAEFFGVDEEDDDVNKSRWDNRRVRIAGSMAKGLKDGSHDTTDGMPRIRDPLRISRQESRMSTTTAGSVGPGGRRDMRKQSVLQMTMKGISNLSHVRKDMRKKSFKGQSFAPGSVSGTIPEDASFRRTDDAFSLVDDVFYDEHPTGTPEAKSVRPELAGEGSAPGWRRRPPQALPSTPGADAVDGPDFGLSRIKDKVSAESERSISKNVRFDDIPMAKSAESIGGEDVVADKQVVQSAMQREKRTVGMGILGNLTRRRLRSAVLTKDVKKQLSNLDDHRPYFTYWVTFVHVVVFIVSVSVYGIAPIGVSTTEESSDVRMPNLAIQRETHLERDNLWIGPRQADLIHLGAKYSPCMRVDDNLNKVIEYDRAEERESACCIRNDGSGCVQTVQSSCSNILSRWDKWSSSKPGPGGRTSGTVCGQDPRYCSNPSSTPPFEWKNKITSWPLCLSTAKPNQSVASVSDQHMNCELLGRPCCFGIQGECIITTREHCDLKRGFFHSEAFLCSQVHCMEEICGMIPFVNSESPDQFYRLWTSLFLHGGLVHLLVSILFQMWIMRDLEKLMGAIRISIIFMGSGIAGNLASCTFIPYQAEAGPSGAHYGIAACLLVEVIQSYQMYREPWRVVLKIVIPILGFFLLGLLPWIDNWAHLFGFLFGFMLAFALVPYVSFGDFDRRRKLISIIVCLGVSVGIFTILVIIFYVAPLTQCTFCIYFNCIPFTADFCANMAVDLDRNSTYSSYT